MMRTVILATLIGSALPIAAASAQSERACGLAPYQLRELRGDTPGIGCRRSQNDVAFAARRKAQAAADARKRSNPGNGAVPE